MWLMKKTLLLTGLATMLAFQSCTMDEIEKVNQGTPIGFRTSVATRGAEAKTRTINAFYVTALEADSDPYFKDVVFTKGGYDGFTSPGQTYYWPGQGRELTFHAYAPGIDQMGGATVTINNNTKEISNFQVNSDILKQVDLIYAFTAPQSEGDVEINFEHKLSMIEVRATTSADYIYKFAGVKLGGIKGTGSLTGLETEDAEQWEIPEDAETKTFTYDGSNSVVTMDKYSSQYLLGYLEDDKGNPTENAAFMIPQTVTPWDPQSTSNDGAYIAVNIQISTPDGVRIYPSQNDGDYAWVKIPVPNVTWLSGYKYYYTLDFSNGAGYDETGTEVLDGSASIKMTMNLDEMPEGSSNPVVNPNMIGKWIVQSFKDVDYYTDGDEVVDYDLDVNRGETPEDRERIFKQITPLIDGFSYIDILDGKDLITYPDTNRDGVIDEKDAPSEQPYILNDDQYILIKCYRYRGEENSTNENDYSPHPQIKLIRPAEGNTDGYAEIEVKFEYTNYTTIQTIKYNIESFEKESN